MTTSANTKIIGLHDGVTGLHDGIYGDVSGIKGDVTSAHGDATGIVLDFDNDEEACIWLDIVGGDVRECSRALAYSRSHADD